MTRIECNPSNIVEAFSSAKPGDTVVLGSGQYDHALVVPSNLVNLNIVGEGCYFLRSVHVHKSHIYITVKFLRIFLHRFGWKVVESRFVI